MHVRALSRDIVVRTSIPDTMHVPRYHSTTVSMVSRLTHTNMNPDTRYQIPDTAREGCIFQIPDTRYHTVSMVSGFRYQIPDTFVTCETDYIGRV